MEISIRFCRWRLGARILLACIFCLIPQYSYAQTSQCQTDNTACIGVLAFRGVDSAIREWTPLVQYLSFSLPDWTFKLIPISLTSAPNLIENHEVDFVITNPGHFITLSNRFNLSALSTLERTGPDGSSSLLRYGTVVLTHTDSDIYTLDSLENKLIAAVSPNAFGGFQIAWHELKQHGIDLLHKSQSIRFMGFPQDGIVTAVSSREVDAGIVRSGLLEQLESENRINMDDFRVINAGTQPGHPYVTSSRLYPEWPFAVLPGTTKLLREQVQLALLATQNPEITRQFNLSKRWSTPASYNDVRVLVNDYRKQNVENPPDSNKTQLFLALTLITLSGMWLLFHRARSATYLQSSLVASPLKVTDCQKPEAVSGELERFQRLTKREKEVLCLICRGLQSKMIAAELNITTKTVEYHRNNLLKKTEAATTAQLVLQASRLEADLGLSLG